MGIAYPIGELCRAAWARHDSADVPGFFVRTISISSACALGAVGASVLLPELFTNSVHPERELWAASVALTLLFEGIRRLIRNELGPNQLVTILAGLGLVAIIPQFEGATWDYECYAAAGKAVATGGDLYAWAHGAPTILGTRYIYSPLLANLFSLLQRIPDRGLAEAPAYLLWIAVVYWAACAFVPLLLRVLHEVYGVPWSTAAVAAVLVGTLSTPALRTIQYSQPNGIVADCLLAWLLLSGTREGRGVGLLSFAAILKTSPVLFFPLLLAQRRWRAGVMAIGCCAAIVALSVASIGARPWVEFLRAAPRVQTFGYHRDNSFASFLSASVRVMGVKSDAVARVGGALFAGGVLLALGARSRRPWPWEVREREPKSAIERHFPAVLFAMCLVSPLLWEHHWVWAALPCVLVTNAAIESGRGMKSCVGTLLIFFVPTFDAFPFSYHRLLGAFLVMADAVASAPPPDPQPVGA